MEGNACYKFETICRFLAAEKQPPIRAVLEFGTNVGEVTAMILEYFPEAIIHSYEVVPKYYQRAAKLFAGNPRVTIFNQAIWGGPEKSLVAYVPTGPAAGPGWGGGTRVRARGGKRPMHYKPMDVAEVVTLDDAVRTLQNATGREQIDYAKWDCEGSEVPALEWAAEATMKALRFMSGEYHSFAEFYPLLERKLFHTHYVNLVGDAGMGSFFAERRVPTILIPQRARPRVRSWLSAEPSEWNTFRKQYIPAGQLADHGR
jgi:FkbM family methyltransferase